MKRTLTRFAFILFFAFIAKTAGAQVIYVDLYISQSNVEDCVTGIETNFQQENLKVFPNPTKGMFTISIDNAELTEKLKIVIHNIIGQVIYTEKIDLTETNLEKQINLSGYPSGTYLLDISSEKRYYKAEIILK